MHVEPALTAAGLLVGFLVGLTGMGGGALMTPLLVLVFKVDAVSAVSSDLVASLIMKPVGGAVHARRGTVHRGLVLWLVAGSVPAAFAGALVLRALGTGDVLQHRISDALGIALLVAAAAIPAKAWLTARRPAAAADHQQVAVRRLPTLAIGVVGGLVVGITSVGSGSLMMVMLLVLYPTLTARELVGTDLVQAIPLVGSAALGHALFGDVSLALTGSLVLGALPGVYAGARVSAGAPDGLVRPALVVVLSASGMKLLGVPTPLTLLTGAAVATVTVAVAMRRRLVAGRARAGEPVAEPVVSLDAGLVGVDEERRRLVEVGEHLGLHVGVEL